MPDTNINVNTESLGQKVKDWMGVGKDLMNIIGPGGGAAFKRGGKVKHTEMAKVHKGELVLTKKQQKKLGAKAKMSK